MPTALLVDQDMDTLLSLADVFREFGYSTQTVEELRRAREILLKQMPEVAVFNETIGDQSSLDMLEDLDLSSVVEIYIMSENRSVRGATHAMRAGASDYFSKPVDSNKLAENLAALQIELDESVDESSVAKDARGLLVGESIAMQRVYRLIRKCAPSDAFVLVSGDSGTGKELVAKTIHELSGRSTGRFVPVNCSAVPSELIESELFGHKKGSFTGATRDHRGFFETASDGTLFLDEITEMSPELQAKLLRVLESHKVHPVGSNTEVKIDTRVIAATNQDPHESVESGRLREDLYYRIAQFPMHLPRLRDRGDDIDLLAEHFLAVQNETSGIEKTFADDVLDAFKLHDWPGNVRELKNAVVHGHLLAGNEICLEDLPDGIPASIPSRGQYVRIAIGTTLDEVQRRYTLSTLAQLDGDKKKTAEVLGISLKTLYNRLKTYRGA